MTRFGSPLFAAAPCVFWMAGSPAGSPRQGQALRARRWRGLDRASLGPAEGHPSDERLFVVRADHDIDAASGTKQPEKLSPIYPV